MALLSPLALLFGLTAIVPLILHLYQRQRRTVMLFSTNRFFTQSVIRSQRRLRLRRLLLLLLRVAACVLLALALARPILSLRGLVGGRAGSRDLVILLDDSLSMGAAEPSAAGVAGTRSRFDSAKRLTLDALGGLAAGDRAAVVTSTGCTLGQRTRTGPALGGDVAVLSSAVERLAVTSAAGDARAGLAHVAELFRGAEQRTRLLLVLTDLQATDWRQSRWPQPDQAIATTLVRLAPPTEDNVVADQMVLSQGTTVVGQPNLLRVRLVNYRPDTARGQLVLRLDDNELVRRPIELAGRSPQIERIPMVFDSPGEHRLTLHVDCTDALPIDNTLYATVLVNPRLAVLVVDGNVDARREESAAFYVKTALSVCSGSAADGHSIEADVIRPPDLPDATLDRYRVVVLSNVRELPLQQLGRLEQFVQAGGGLAIFLGDRTDARFYNEVMGAASRALGGLLPAEVRSQTEFGDSVQPMHILEADLEHPVLQRFKDALRGALAGISIYRAYSVAPREAWVVASMEKRLPLMVERGYGRGKVILIATMPTPRWTNLPLRRVFVPLMNRLVGYLAGGGAVGADHAVGEELVLLRGGWNDASSAESVYARRPDGARVQAAVKVSGGELVSYLAGDVVSQPGFYHLELPKSARPLAGSSPGEWLAVNAPRRESMPGVLEPAELKRLASNWQIKTLDLSAGAGKDQLASRTAIGSSLNSGGASRGIWDWLLWLVLALVLIEPLIANRIAGRRATEARGQTRRAA